FFVAMDMAAIDIVFRCVIAQQTQIQKIRRARQKFKRGKISFVKWGGIGPDPANAMFFQQPDKLRPMPAGMPKFDRKAEISRELWKKCSQRELAVSGR